jgi:TP901 family phage tail tape measure protein
LLLKKQQRQRFNSELQWFERLEDNVRRLSLQFGQSPTEQARALYQVVSAGAQEASQAIDVLTISNKLAIAGITDVAVAADALTTIMNSYSGAAGTAIDISDTLFVGVKAGKTTIDELAGGIGRLTGFSAQLNVSFEEMVAAVSALTLGTLNTRESIRGLRGVLSAVIKPTQEAVDLAEDLGLQFDAAALSSKGFAKFLGEVSEATNNNSALLSVLFGNIMGLLPVMSLVGTASDDFASILDQMGEKAGRTDKAFEIMSNTFEFKVNRFMTATKIIAIDIGNVLLTALAPAAELAAENIDLLATALISLALAIASVKLGGIIAGVKALTVAVKGLFVIVLAHPFLAIFAAIAVGIVALNRKFMIFEPTWELIKNTFLLMVNSIMQAFNVLQNWLSRFFTTTSSLVLDLKIKLLETFVAISEAIPGSPFVDKFKRDLNELVEQQNELNQSTDDSIKSREKANQELAKENALLIENLKVAKDQLFTARETQEVQSGAGAPNAPSAPGTPELNEELAEQQRLQVRLLELQERGLQLTKDLRTPTEIYVDQMKELNELFNANAIDLETFNRAQKEYQEAMGESAEQTEQFGDLFDRAINGTLEAKDIFLIGIKQIIAGLFEMNKEAQSTTDSFLKLGNSLGGGGGFGSSLGGIVSSIFGSFFSPAPAPVAPPPSFSGFNQPGILAANGGVHSRGVMKFANGGVFNSPLTFPLAGGRTGMMAEAGSEAIMPLERTAGGKLGVNASGNSSEVIVNIIDQRTGGERAQVTQTTDAQGNKKFDILIKDSVNRTFGAGGFDKSMKQFGAIRGGNRR